MLPLYFLSCDDKYSLSKFSLASLKDNERLSEIFTYEDHPKIINVLSGKVSTCHKLGQEIKRMVCV